MIKSETEYKQLTRRLDYLINKTDMSIQEGQDIEEINNELKDFENSCSDSEVMFTDFY